MQPMAERLRADHQGLQQILSSSTWTVERAGGGLGPPVVVAEAGCGDVAEFRGGLSPRGRAWVVQGQGVLSAHAESGVPALVPTSGGGRPSRPRYRTAPLTLREHVQAAGRAAAVPVTWR